MGSHQCQGTAMSQPSQCRCGQMQGIAQAVPVDCALRRAATPSRHPAMLVCHVCAGSASFCNASVPGYTRKAQRSRPIGIVFLFAITKKTERG